MKPLLFILLSLSPLLAAENPAPPEKTHITYETCEANDHPAFSVVVTYDIKNFTTRSETLYFKKVIITEGTLTWGGIRCSVGCGPGISLSTSIQGRTENDGIHISTKLHQTGQNPNEYSSQIVLPWTSEKVNLQDDRATIIAVIKWTAS